MNKKNRKTVRFAGAVLAAIGLGLFGVVTAKLYTDKINTENSIKERYLTEAAGRDVIEESPLEEENSDNFWLLQTDDSGNIELQGKAYRRNTAVKAILLIGADTAGQMEKSPVIGSAPFPVKKTTPGRLRSPRGCYKNDLLFQEIRLFSLALSQTRQVWSLVT